MKVSGKEYLAAAHLDDGCLYSWDIESRTSKKVFDPNLPVEQHYKYMNIFKINNNTLGYGEDYASSDGSRRVFILKTNTEELTLYSTLRLFTSQNIWDICSTNLEDGTPCLLLCVPHDHCVMAVEMTTGETRWEAAEEQMGEKFYPSSICTDEDNTVYVPDFKQHTIHLLSAEDGSIITSIIDAGHYGMWNLIAVRFHDHHLYVERYRNPGYKYAISKYERKV